MENQLLQNVSMLLIGLSAGVLSGLFGIGGGIIIVPALVLLLGMTQQTASATSLVALLLPVGILGVLEYYREGKISMDNVWLGLLLALGLFTGAYFGARIATHLSGPMLRRAFAVFTGIVALRLWFK
ncbi:sulfite exporter TauE/SafE family protein [Chlorobium sp. N1]|uniref:sulfite exporter TauE/SafE family protein n=1 Tax=Chlorobium sp. N1 TaxID=2491138 RepID=UPI00103EE871|nr:sulfite exporter TauE/SafE family protein [Chlorobium sp. N1]TCD48852.1 sulfite exporter TauE/SafE family protein [Chlorobium sp. N1]